MSRKTNLFLLARYMYDIVVEIKTKKMRSRLFLILVASVLHLQFVFFSAHIQTEYSRKEALKVVNLVDIIQREQLEKEDDETRYVLLTESELNSYIAHRIKVEHEEILRELRLKLYDNNKVEWKIMLDLLIK